MLRFSGGGGTVPDFDTGVLSRFLCIAGNFVICESNIRFTNTSKSYFLDISLHSQTTPQEDDDVNRLKLLNIHKIRNS